MHHNHIFVWSEHIKNILCEKPIDTDLGSVKFCMKIEKKDKADIRMVCNWKYALHNPEIGALDIDYGNYNTGKDGTGWDCIQLVYLAKKLTVYTSTPFFRCSWQRAVNDTGLLRVGEVTLAGIEQSYITMIKHWLGLDGLENDLWNLTDALKATEKTLTWIKENE